MSDEVKRLWIKNEDGLVDVFNVRKHVLDYKPEGFDEKTPLGPRYIEVLRIEDHERIVADLNHKLAIKSRGYTREEYMEEIFRYEKTIASQKRVIEMLKIIERIVTELKAQVSEQAQTIATQKRVIAVLTDCIIKEDHRCGIWPEGRKAIALATSIDKGEA